MRLGVLFCAYDCAPLLSQVLQPWLEARREIDIKIAAVHGQFKEYHDLGIEDNDEETQLKLKDAEWKSQVDNLYLQNDYHLFWPDRYYNPLYQDEAKIRNHGLKYLLNEKCDYVILLDGDEIYTIEDIRSIYDYIQKDSFIALYKIKMRNLVFDSNHYTLDFCPPRVWKVDLSNYTLDAFNFDNDCIYKGIITRDIKFDKDFPCKIIPNVSPLHHTWNDLERSKKKIAYQKIHFSHGAGCSFKVSDDGTRLEWNEEYFKKTGQIKPQVFELCSSIQQNRVKLQESSLSNS